MNGAQVVGLQSKVERLENRIIQLEAVVSKILQKENGNLDNDLSYEKECPEAFGFDNYGSNNG